MCLYQYHRDNQYISIMEVSVTLHRVTLNNQVRHDGMLKIYIGDEQVVETAKTKQVGTCFHFMETNTLQIKAEPTFVKFVFFLGDRKVASLTVFQKEALLGKQVFLKSAFEDRLTYRLEYRLKINHVISVSQQQGLPTALLKGKTLSKQQSTKDQSKISQLEIISLGKDCLEFSKKLDPLIKVTGFMKQVVFWEKPELTLGFGVALTLMVLFPKTSILIFGLCLFFGRDYIISKIQKSIAKEDIRQRLIPPPKNLNFLSQCMQLYNKTFELVYGFLKRDDRSKLISIIGIITKCGLVLIILEIFFSIETILVIMIWFLLFLTTDSGKKLIKRLEPELHSFNKKVDRIIKGKVFGPEGSASMVKTFYIYEHQRWWVGKGWVVSSFADEDNKVSFNRRDSAPPGWRWETEWQPEFSAGCDLQGFQYRNDLTANYSKRSENFNILDVLRRRKWVRKCVRDGPDMKQTRNQSPQKISSIQRLASPHKRQSSPSPHNSPQKSSNLRLNQHIKNK